MTKFIIVPITSGSQPALGLSPIIKIRNVQLNTVIIDDDLMTEIGDGWYKYNFISYSNNEDYAIRVDATNNVPDEERYYFAGNEDFSDSVWEKNLSDFNVPGTMGWSQNKMLITSQSVDTIRAMTEGRWKLENAQMVFYDKDNITEVARFDLYDADENDYYSESDSPIERRRVS